ncbi:MAG: carbohydrate ABC transporter permease, partial [Oscillospiraceae bacterium]|nr:carbohydrate ABC transporter permease [Oscillospiraceae bacterium]
NVSKGLILKPLKNVDTTAYKMILQYQSLWVGYRNTLMYIVMSCAITGILTVIAGYVFSRNRFYYRNAFMMIISFTMLFNGGMIPTYMVINKLGMLDTIWAIVIPGSLNVFNIILMRTSMQGISDALEEAARLDGANDFTIMFKIILPLCKATFAVIMLFTIVMKWNDFMSALLYLPTRKDLYPLQMALRTILFDSSQQITSASDVNASSVYARSVE